MGEPTNFIETLFGFKVDRMRVVAEQAVCVVCGKGSFHAHATPPLAPRPSAHTPQEG